MLAQHVVSRSIIHYPESFGGNLRGIRYARAGGGVAFRQTAANISRSDIWPFGPKWRKHMVVLKKINLTKAFAAFDETWTPHIGGDINDFQVKLTKLEGAFHWHHHEEEDELFLVVKGTLRMKLRDENGGDIVLGPGEYIIVPHGVEHCPVAEPSCEVVLFERNTTLNTGNVENERTIREPKRL
ncbi:mannose-6-phosphate isomerase-like protein (cupin superfamily) [Rhizobium sp. WW_1]|jgi:mannose-6-phosphate isomerase-like protein (cupin superfamily)|nr:mannose-6-phosphate isomerase-like protein (cupin superfamily) [Rhizobium sp. WW_1]